jgi:hypothetical protein
MDLHNPEQSSYIDPDYETVEEVNGGYQRLVDYNEDNEDANGTNDDDTGSYVQPNEVRIDATITEDDKNSKRHSYLEILESPEIPSFADNEDTDGIEIAAKLSDDQTTTD